MKTVTRLSLTCALVLGLTGQALAQSPVNTSGSSGSFPNGTLGVTSFLGYSVDFEDPEHYNAFDVTRGYLNIQANFSPRLRVRFTPDVRPTTDAALTRNLALRLEYAMIETDLTDKTKLGFGLHETPWIAFEQSINRYRVQGPMFAERLGLIPGQTDLGASIKTTRWENLEVHAGIYNGEGYGQQEPDRFKSLQGRATYTVYVDEAADTRARISGFYTWGWYALDRPRNVAIAMGSYESPNVVATAQYLQATDNPFVAVDIERRGLSFFGEYRGGPTGWAGFGRLELLDPDASNDNDSQRRLVFGGAHWSTYGQGRLGVVISLEQAVRTVNSERIENRLLVQTHVEF
jgi:hypothetical protein